MEDKCYVYNFFFADVLVNNIREVQNANYIRRKIYS
jgi:hypothetical protein